MSEPNPPRRPLATFLRPAAAPPAATDEPAQAPAAVPAAPMVADAGAAPTAAPTDADADADAAASTAQAPADHNHEAPPAPAAAVTAATQAPSHAPGFLRVPVERLRTPRWQWATVAILGMLLLLQIALADRARLAADAGHRPWVAALCGVLRCSLPAWHEPSAFTMVSRDVRPVLGQPGALQVVASLRNDARWAQTWPRLRLSLSDADGRVIGTAVFSASQYLGAEGTADGLIEPGQSAQIAFRVREPAASTVAFTFEFL